MRIKALIKRICQQMIRDKRTLGLLFLAPLIILSLMYFLFNSTSINPELGVININSSLIQLLQNSGIDIKEYSISPDTSINEIIIQGNLDGMLQSSNNEYVLTLQNTDPSVAKSLQMKVTQAVSLQFQSKQNISLANLKASNIDVQYVYGSSSTTFFDVLSPVLVGFFVFFFVFLISGIGLLRERMTGTLERLMSTPIRRSEVVTGYLLGFGIFAVIQTIIVIMFSISILTMPLVGSLWNVIVINLLVAFVALSLGILLSTFASSEFQMVQFIPIIIVPQVFFSGIFPLEGLPYWIQIIAKIMPIYYTADALKGIMYEGLVLIDLWKDIIALTTFAIIFIILNIIALKRYRKL